MTKTPLPTGYNPPNVFTQTTIDYAQPIIDGSNKTVVLIGTSDEVNSAVGVEMIRGSSATLDNPIYGEDHSEIANNSGKPTFILTTRFFPVVDGSGLGKITKDPTKVSVYLNGEPVNVVSVNGQLGVITLQQPALPGDQLTVDYFFKKKDTYISGMNLSSAVPTAAKLTVTIPNPNSPTPLASLVLAQTNTGPAGNASSIRFIASATGSPDYSAVQFNGSDALVIDLVSGVTVVAGSGGAPDTEVPTFRTMGELADLIAAYAFTASGGLVKVSALTGSIGRAVPCSASLVHAQATPFSGGTGQSSNMTFQVSQVPMVDGTNGGVVTTNPSDVQVTVDGQIVGVTAVDGQHGFFTLANPVAEGSSLTVSYFTNTYQYTADQLPNVDIIDVQQCGYSVRGIDFIPGNSFVIDSDPVTNTWFVDWGTAVSAKPLSTTLQATPFGQNVITTKLVDHKLYMIPAAGSCNGVNTIFTLATVPVDGTGHAIVTDNPSYISVFVGPDPYTASISAPVTVVRLTGSTAQVILRDAPATGNNVYVSYWESILSDATFTLSCVTTGPGNMGSYSAISSQGNVVGYTRSAFQVDDAYFHSTGVVWPHNMTDFLSIPGAAADEVITLTFTSPTRYTVTSNRTAAQAKADGYGITEGVGYLNQTFRDSNTGVQFTMINPGDTGVLEGYGYTSPVEPSYVFQAGDTIVFTGTKNTAFLTGSGNPVCFIPGVEMVVQNTLGMPTGDQAAVQTYNKSGDQPSVGDVYYITYTYAKPASAYDLRVYYSTQEAQIYQDYGFPNPTNALSLAAWLALRNGAKLVGLMQVKKDPTLLTANDSKYVEAFTKLQSLYPGMEHKPEIIVPLTTSLTLLPYFKKHVETQSSMRMAGECVGFFGFANGTNPATVISTCQGMYSNRMVGAYPDGGVIQLADGYGNTRSVVVDGSFCAVALAAMYGDPQWDTATPRTRKPVVGFTRLYRRMDPNIMNAVAASGCTLVEQVGSIFRIRHAMTTDPSDVLSIQPSITFLADEVQREIRKLLDPYIGQKFLNSVLTAMRNDMTFYFKVKVDRELVQTYGDITVKRDPNDSRIARIQATYVPVGELTYIIVDLSIRSMADQ